MHSSGSILHILPVLQLMGDKERKTKLELLEKNTCNPNSFCLTFQSFRH